MGRNPNKVRITLLKQRIHLWRLMNDAVTRGLNIGYHRAHKHTDKPTEEHLKNEMDNAIMNELSEIINFDE